MAEEFIVAPADALNGNNVHTFKWNDGVNDIHTPIMQIADRNDPTKRQSVDNKGAAKVEFNNGSPDFTVFGRTTVTESNLMGVYKFYEKNYDLEFHKHEDLGATVAYDASNYGMKLTNPVTSGAVSGYFTNKYFQYRPGNSMPLIFTMKAGDGGKTNLERRVGWFGNEGAIRMCFLQTATGIAVEIADDAQGTSVIIDRANWSEDRLDGSNSENNLSGATYDAVKNNIWWIDFQFLGAGAVRFGTFVNGEKVLCHIQGNYNALDRPYLSEARFAFGMEQKNTGVTSGTSELHVYCAVITNDGYDEFDRETSTISNQVSLSSTSFVPIISFRPTLLKDGRTNRNRLLPMLASIACQTVTGNMGIEIIAEINTPITGATWAESIDGIEYDIGATGFSVNGLRKVGAFLAADKSDAIEMTNIFPIQTSGITRNYHPANSDHVTIMGRLIDATGSPVSIAAVSVTITEVE